MGCFSSKASEECKECAGSLDRQKNQTTADMQQNAQQLVQWDQRFSATLFEVEAKLGALTQTVVMGDKVPSSRRPCRLPQIGNPLSSEEEAINNISAMTSDMVAWVETYHHSLKAAREAVTKVMCLTSLNPVSDINTNKAKEPPVVCEVPQ